jgi:THO complex subunit 5
MQQSPEAEEVILTLRQLATNSSPNDDPASIHIRAGALFARLKALNRDANAAARAHKQITADARQDMDQTHLRLQNLLYEKRHLEREIEKCRQFAYVSIVRRPLFGSRLAHTPS